MLFVLCAALLILAAGLRALPYYLAPQGAGVDHWFWKSYVETYRRERVFPPVLPQYTLDEHQWYPPLFPLLLAKLPPQIFDRWNHVVAVALDLARMTVLLGAAYWQGAGNLRVIAVAGLIYATIPIQTSYNIQLNPRGLGALMLEVVLLLLLWIEALGGSAWLWVPVVVLSGLILLTHKMTTQVFWFIILGTALIYRNWPLLGLIPASMAAAFVLSGGFYVKVLRAHAEIVAFWNRNWRWIGADWLRESPIYGDPSYERPEKLHPPGLKGLVWKLYVLFGFNPAAWIACLLVYERLLLPSPVLIYPTYLLVWLLLPCLWALLTTFLPPLKCLGAGYLYVYNTSLLAALLLSLTFEFTRAPEVSTALVVVSLTLNVAGLVTYYIRFTRDRRARVDTGLAVMLDALVKEPSGVVWCIPSSWSEVVSYKTGHAVLWGGHGYGFGRMEPVWPRLLMPVRDLFAQYQVRYLLTMEGMLPESFVRDLPPARIARHGEYCLYCFDETASRPPSGVSIGTAMVQAGRPATV